MLGRGSDPPSLLTVLGVLLGAAVFAFVLATVLHVGLRRLARRATLPAELSKHSRRPMAVTLVLAAVYGALHSFPNVGTWQRAVEHVLFLGLIGAVAWLVASLAFVVEDAAITRYRVDVRDNRHARRVRTQVIVVRRVTVALISALAVAAMLMTFPSARAAGTSLLASAGILGVIAGLAAQSTLSNTFAGLQIALTDWLRLDDVVVVEGEWAGSRTSRSATSWSTSGTTGG